MGAAESAATSAKPAAPDAAVTAALAADDKLKAAAATLPLFTSAQVAKHNTQEDLWVVVDGLVYDVTPFTDHPGGNHILYAWAGKDATDAFEEVFHSAKARQMMRQYLVGSVQSDTKPTKAAAAAAPASTPAESKQSNTTATSSTNTTSTNTTTTTTTSTSTALKVKVLFGSQKGNAKAFANRIAQRCQEFMKTANVTVVSMDKYEPEDLVNEQYVVFVASTYTDGIPPANAKFFMDWLEDTSVDFRRGKTYLEKLRCCVYGLGDSLYEEHFNTTATKIAKCLRKLGAKAICSAGVSDYSTERSKAGDAEADFVTWVDKVFAPAVQQLATAKQGADGSALPPPVDDDYDYDDADDAPEVNDDEEEERAEEATAAKATAAAVKALRDKKANANPATAGKAVKAEKAERKEGSAVEAGEKLVDLEDMAKVLTANKNKASGNTRPKKPKKQPNKPNKLPRPSAPAAAGEVTLQAKASESKVDSDDEGAEAEDEDDKPTADGKPRQMLTDQVRKTLTKQGYQLLGSHSGVKLCRWTKAMLRGRGGCYKHTFYGIQSFQCMEMTPSLACANKCVFCWRHHSNPVGKTWRWEVDEPRRLVDEAIQKHRFMVKQYRGVPGVQPERLEEAMQIKHCALSLVGEPIMYPHINQFVDMLHKEGISTFLVTNAQFPERIVQMAPVTQLYVSVDASTQDSLKAIDRPLFKDFWQRFIDSLKALKHKQQRTVYRLTLVKDVNMSDAEIREYAGLVSLGRPTFIEIKGVTFCGESNASNLTMGNVPWHHEVRNFALQLCKLLDGNYELACEHAHSCCVLISDTKLKVNGKWHTHIDYPKFLKLVAAHSASKGESNFTALDYALPTPEWAVFGASEAGFDPNEKRFRRKTKPEKLADKEKAAAAGCTSAECKSDGAPADSESLFTGCSCVTASDTPDPNCCKAVGAPIRVLPAAKAAAAAVSSTPATPSVTTATATTAPAIATATTTVSPAAATPSPSPAPASG
jgi:tRNA wybutosine-synthesizing protein 1